MGGLSLGVDILIKDRINLDILKSSISESFDIKITELLIIDDDSSVNNNVGIKLLCYVYKISGDFRLLLSFFIKENSLECSIDTIQKLSSRLQTECLFPDESINPYQYLLIEPTGTIKRVYLNDDDLDVNIYTIDKENK